VEEGFEDDVEYSPPLEIEFEKVLTTHNTPTTTTHHSPHTHYPPLALW
jgi:hypothetical protein